MAKSGIAKTLGIIGAILIFIDGILGLLAFFGIFNFTISFLGSSFFTIAGLGWLNPVIILVIGILALISVDIFKGGIPFNGIWMLVLGIAAIVFGSWFIGGVLLIIAAIILFIK